jgi:hypothetical protein
MALTVKKCTEILFVLLTCRCVSLQHPPKVNLMYYASPWLQRTSIWLSRLSAHLQNKSPLCHYILKTCNAYNCIFQADITPHISLLLLTYLIHTYDNISMESTIYAVGTVHLNWGWYPTLWLKTMLYHSSSWSTPTPDDFTTLPTNNVKSVRLSCTKKTNGWFALNSWISVDLSDRLFLMTAATRERKKTKE